MDAVPFCGVKGQSTKQPPHSPTKTKTDEVEAGRHVSSALLQQVIWHLIGCHQKRNHVIMALLNPAMMLIWVEVNPNEPFKNPFIVEFRGL